MHGPFLSFNFIKNTSMRNSLPALFLAGLVGLPSALASTYPATLSGCLAFAALFDNTCTSLTTATSFSSVPSKT
jgi:hypothetical protein